MGGWPNRRKVAQGNGRYERGHAGMREEAQISHVTEHSEEKALEK
jgi:hypothetical protein